MDKKLEQKLFMKYPELFRQKDLPMSETALCFGCQCNNGWFSLLDGLCSWITWHMKKNSHMFPKIEFTTIKEKFGRLRVYYTPIDCTKDQAVGTNEFEGAISFAEDLSATICEDCGKPGKLYCVDKWYLTCCPKHLKSYIAYIKKQWGKKTVTVIDCSKEEK